MTRRFEANGERFRLTVEAFRIRRASLFDPFWAARTSAVEPTPHQISAVYGEMLPRTPLRFLLADDPGAGKTIMTGMFLKEATARGDVKRCLIVAPGNLVEQWQDELRQKFGLLFEIVEPRGKNDASGEDVWKNVNFAIARLDKLARDDEIRRSLERVDWDLVVCDEAHKMAATLAGTDVRRTKRFRLGRLLAQNCRHFLLLTATPHNGKNDDFRLFLSLLDADRFEGQARRGVAETVDASDLMRRLVKEDLLKFDGTPLFPERIAQTLSYALSQDERRLYDAVTRYVEREFDRADQLTNARKTAVGFALTVLQRRLASSPEAILQSLTRRKARLEERLRETLAGGDAVDEDFDGAEFDDERLDENAARENEELENAVVDRASAASTVAELEAEIATLAALVETARRVRASGTDRKWDELSRLLQENENMFDRRGKREKIIVFTEHRDTLNYLATKIRTLLGEADAVATICGETSRSERRKVETAFRQDPNVRVLVATDAAGEGVNLQTARLTVNYDLPWNPNRLEQRFGRVHRIGQTEVCRLWNLVAKETREGAVFERLTAKLENERKSLGGKVFDVLGKLAFEEKSLRELLVEAIRHGDRPETRARLERAIDVLFERENLTRLLRERASTEQTLTAADVEELRLEMERSEARKLQPYFIETFFRQAFETLGGRMVERETGRREILQTPLAIRRRGEKNGAFEPILKRYERICFDKKFRDVPGAPPAELLSPGRPLLDATLDEIIERFSNEAATGATLIDEQDESDALRLLLFVEFALEDGAGRRVGRRARFIASRQGEAAAFDAGPAPHLDCRAATSEEIALVLNGCEAATWASVGETKATAFATSTAIPEALREERERRAARVERTRRAVKARLETEIDYWDRRANELRDKASTKGVPEARLDAAKASARADELAERLEKRLAELTLEGRVSATAPNVVARALIVPRGLLKRLSGKKAAAETSVDAEARAAVERTAVDAVLRIERERGRTAVDVGALKIGYDVESRTEKRGNCNDRSEQELSAIRAPLFFADDVESQKGERVEPELLFIEVKGRAAGSETVTMTRNEILTALNKPDEFLLALVEVDGARTRTTYLRRPFKTPPDFGATSVTYRIEWLLRNSEVVLRREFND